MFFEPPRLRLIRTMIRDRRAQFRTRLTHTVGPCLLLLTAPSTQPTINRASFLSIPTLSFALLPCRSLAPWAVLRLTQYVYWPALKITGWLAVQIMQHATQARCNSAMSASMPPSAVGGLMQTCWCSYSCCDCLPRRCWPCRRRSCWPRCPCGCEPVRILGHAAMSCPELAPV